MTWVQILAQWSLIVSDFHSEYGIELEEAQHVKPWKWFDTRVTGLLAADTRLARYFVKKPDRTEQ